MIRKAEIKDLAILAELACQLWPDHTVEETRIEYAQIIDKPDAVFYLAFAQETAVGFAQCQLRCDYVEGTDSSPVGYLMLTEQRKKYCATIHFCRFML